MARDENDAWQAEQDQNLGTGDFNADLASFNSATAGNSVSLSDLTGSLPNPGSLSSLIPKGPSGLNENLGKMQGLQSQISDKIKSGAGGFGSLINETKTNLSAAAGEIKPPAPNLQDKMKGLMGSISSFNPLAAVQLKDVTTTFPDFDIKGAFSKMGSGNFNFNKDIPNLESVGGKVIEKAAPTLAPSEDPLDLEDAPDAPEVVKPALPVGVGVISNDIVGKFKDLGSLFNQNPARAQVAVDNLYWETKDQIDEKAKEIGATQQDWSGGGTADDWEKEQDKNLGTGDINADFAKFQSGSSAALSGGLSEAGSEIRSVQADMKKQLSDPNVQADAQKSMALLKELSKLDMLKAMSSSPAPASSKDSAFQTELNANAKEFKIGVSGRLAAAQSEVVAEKDAVLKDMNQKLSDPKTQTDAKLASETLSKVLGGFGGF